MVGRQHSISRVAMLLLLLVGYGILYLSLRMMWMVKWCGSVPCVLVCGYVSTCKRPGHVLHCADDMTVC